MIYVHLLNDNSGSPRVLKAVIKSISSKEDDSILFVGSQGNGILNGCDINISRYFYRRSRKKYITLLFYILSQIDLFLKLTFSKSAHRNDTIYINTLLPFSAAVWGWLFRKKIVYHIHEISISPPLLFKFLMYIADELSYTQIYVSNTHKNLINSSHKNRLVLHNCVPHEIFSASINHKCVPFTANFTILMPCSLKSYKGVKIFTKLAQVCTDPSIKWRLLLNEDDNLVDEFRYINRSMLNLEVLNRVNDPTILYKNANLVVNLSLVTEWIETFGMTLVEAFSFGLPVIAPPVGGPTEFVVNGENGFLINSTDTDVLMYTILKIKNDTDLYQKLSQNARKTALQFSPDKFSEKLSALFN